jgi:hypothetical protein
MALQNLVESVFQRLWWPADGLKAKYEKDEKNRCRIEQ